MKKLIFFSTMLIFISCEKEWKCTTVTNDLGMNYESSETITGSKEDAEAYEQEHTSSEEVYSWSLDTTYTVSQETTCVRK